MKYEMIIFDLDGTLWETSNQSYKSANSILKKYNNKVEILQETVDKTMGCTFAKTAELYMPYYDEEKREFILKEMLDKVSQTLSIVGGNVYPNLEETLKKLKEKYELAIVSNCDAGYIESFLESAKLEKYFKDFMAAAKMKIPKAEAIQRVINRNNITSAIYVGDTINDANAAKGAGIEFIHAKYGFGKDIEADYSIERIIELPELLEKIEQEKM